MKYNDNGQWKDVQIKVANAIQNEYGESNNDGYSQNYLNDKVVNVSNELDEDYGVNVLHSHNLFNKNSFNKLNGYYVSESQSTISQSGQNMQTLYISIVGGKTYTVSKVAGVNFRCATTQVLPAPGVTVADQIDKNTATSITITTSSSAKYLCVSYYSNTETQTEQTILNSIMINEGSTALPYEPYITPSIYVDNEEIYSKPICGSNNNGSYIKYADGTMICFGTISKTLNITSTYTNSYYANTSITFPETFVENPIVNLTPFSLTDLISNSIYSITLSAVNFFVFSNKSLSNANVIINYIAIGKWDTTNSNSTRNIETPQEETR